MDVFVEAARASVATMFPTMKDNPDYTSVINQRHYERLTGYVEEARAAGATVIELAPEGEDFRQQEHRKIPPTLIIDPGDDLKVMQEEIFGPILPVKGYSSLDEAVGYVNDHPRPLGLYYFGTDAAEREAVLTRTTSGGVTVNDVVFHVAQEDLPFGGIGPSGMGSYHGLDGFREFSHRKAVYSQLRAELGALKAMRPPYGEGIRKFLAGAIVR
jgi:coniferyl-aldehyde dehydrogenase